MKTRLAKYLGHAGVCSRRQASRLIDQGVVMVNGRAANHIDHVDQNDEITVEGKPITGLPEKVLYIYHKPVGQDCKLNVDDPSSIIHHLPSNVRVYPIGRLDKDSRGLLLLTNDGELCHRLIHPDHHEEKEYLVTVDKPLDAHFCQNMAQGVPVDGHITKHCVVEQIDETRFKIILKQGLNRQIRKMSHHFGYRVIDLYRIRIAGLILDPNTTAEGHYKSVSFSELGLTD